MKDQAIVIGDKRSGYKVVVNFIQIGCTYQSEESANKYRDIYNDDDK